MKKILLLTFILISGLLIKAQQSDLNNLSTGVLTNFESISDSDGNLYGYLVIYQLDKIDKNTKNFEYILLDKNLNKISNNDFTSTNLADNYSGFLAPNGDLVLKPVSIITDFRDYKIEGAKTYTVNLKDNVIKEKMNYCFENDNLYPCEQENDSYVDLAKKLKKERKANKSVKKSDVSELNDGYLVNEYTEMILNKYKTYQTDNVYKKFDADGNKMWELKFNEDATKDQSETYAIFAWEDDYAYILKILNGQSAERYSMAVLDLKNGKIMTEYDISENFPNLTFLDFLYYGRFDNTFNNDEFFRFISRYGDGANTLGFLTFNYDKKNNLLYTKTLEYLDFNNVTNDVRFKASGEIEGENANIETRDIYFLNDGSVGVLTEKTKNTGNKIITTDMVLLTTDKDLQPQEVTILEKDKSKSYYASDYLFSQYINDGKDVVFFYRDYRENDDSKDKNWVLYINTIIDGKFHQEQIPISSDENFIYPSMAKEGYILLREFNKNAKYDQIRLERLNY